MEIKHVRMGGIYKIINDIQDDNNEIVIPKGHIVQVQASFYIDNFVQVKDLTAQKDQIFVVNEATLGYLTYADLYAEEYPQTEANQNKDSPHYNSHYTNMIGLQPIELMQEVLSSEEFRGFLKGNIIKYTMRAGHKEGEAAEKDNAKAKVYLRWLNDAKGYIPIKVDR